MPKTAPMSVMRKLTASFESRISFCSAAPMTLSAVVARNAAKTANGSCSNGITPSPAAIAASAADPIMPAKVPSSETAPSVPRGTGESVVMRYVERPYALPISEPHVSESLEHTAHTNASSSAGCAGGSAGKRCSAAHSAAAPPAPQTFSGPRAPPRDCAIPSASFCAYRSFVSREPTTKKITPSSQPCAPNDVYSAMPSSAACTTPARVSDFCDEARTAAASAPWKPSATAGCRGASSWRAKFSVPFACESTPMLIHTAIRVAVMFRRCSFLTLVAPSERRKLDCARVRTRFGAPRTLRCARVSSVATSPPLVTNVVLLRIPPCVANTHTHTHTNSSIDADAARTQRCASAISVKHPSASLRSLRRPQNPPTSATQPQHSPPRSRQQPRPSAQSHALLRAPTFAFKHPSRTLITAIFCACKSFPFQFKNT
mmetsp:Transcript_15496/g.41616  ORF Transcript_15496/g.41616 Transcript_15496/m.41616 type:complete len:431 (+) Transcript_15496:803-2095(+)